MSDPLDAQIKRLLDAGRLARLAGVAGEPQSRGTRRIECRSQRDGRVANLVAGKIETDHPTTRVPSGLPGQRDVFLDCVVPHRAYDRDCAQRCRREPREHGLDHLGYRQPTFGVQSRRPANLEVVDVLRR